jgi:hypothetical protein
MSEPEHDHRIFHFDEGVVSLPRGFRDRSVQMLEWTVDNSSSLVLVIQRERLGAGGVAGSPATLDAYVASETRDYPTRFLGYRLEETEYPDPFDGAYPIARRVFRWKNERDVLYNHQVFVLSAPLVLVFTVTAKAVHRERADKLVKDALVDLRFRED